MRIVMVAHSFPRREDDVAGAFLWRLAEALVDRGHAVTAVAPADRGQVGTPMLGRIPVHRVRYASPARETLAYAGTMHRLATSPAGAMAFAGLVRGLGRAARAAARSANADLIHAHWWVPAGLAVRLVTGHQPFVVTLHGTDVALAMKLPLGRRLMGWVLRPAARVTAVSSFLAAQAASVLGVPVERIARTPMPIAPAAPSGFAGPGRGALFVGRLTRQKGVDVLLEALAILGPAAPDLTVVGDGPERRALETRAAALGVRASFVGAVEPRQVAERIRRARLLVLPARDEGLGLVVAEALALGVPVVATRSGGIPDLLPDPDAGLLVPAGDARALAAAIATVGSEERFLAGASRAGRALSASLAPDRVAAGLEAVYRAALGDARS